MATASASCSLRRWTLEKILREYRTTRFPDRSYNLKIGVPWADLERRVGRRDGAGAVRGRADAGVVRNGVILGVDTGKQLHAVVLRQDPNDDGLFHVVHLAVCTAFTSSTV